MRAKTLMPRKHSLQRPELVSPQALLMILALNTAEEKRNFSAEKALMVLQA